MNPDDDKKRKSLNLPSTSMKKPRLNTSDQNIKIECDPFLSTTLPNFDIGLLNNLIRVKQEFGSTSNVKEEPLFTSNVKKETVSLPFIPEILKCPETIRVEHHNFVIMGLNQNDNGKITKLAMVSMKNPLRMHSFNISSSTNTLKEKLNEFIQDLPWQSLLIYYDDNGKRPQAETLLCNVENHGLMESLKKKVLGFCNMKEAFNCKGMDLAQLLKKYSNSVNFETDIIGMLPRQVYNLAQLICFKYNAESGEMSYEQKTVILEESRTVDCVIEQKKYEDKRRYCMETLQPLIIEKHVTNSTARKLARSGISYNNLEYAFVNHGSNGLKELLKSREINDRGVMAKIVCGLSS